MSKLICHCCGASAKPTTSSQFVDCEFCGSSISAVEFFKSVSANTIKALEDFGLSEEEQKNISRLFNNAEIYLESEDFEKSREVFESILNIYPQHTESRLNCAICILYDKKLNSLEKSELAHNYCTKSIKPHQITPEIQAILENISYNLSTLAIKEQDSEDTFKIFTYSKNIILDLEHRDKIIYEYSQKLFQSFEKQIENNINNKKDQYSPNSSFLNTILNFSDFYPNFSSLGLSLCEFMKNNKKNIQSRALEMIPKLEDKLIPLHEGKIIKYSFSLFGGLKKTEIDYLK